MIFVDHADVLVGVDDRAALASLLDEVAVGGSGDRAVVLAARDRESVADLIPTRTPTSAGCPRSRRQRSTVRSVYRTGNL